MKKLLCLLFVVIGALGTLSAQKNTISLSLQPDDFGLGIRYDRDIARYGVYASLSYGNYNLLQGYIKDHYKIAIGGKAHFNTAYLTLGGSLHRYGERNLTDISDNSRVLQPVSFEIGVGSRLDKVSIAFRMDVLKWESVVDIGFSF